MDEAFGFARSSSLLQSVSRTCNSLQARWSELGATLKSLLRRMQLENVRNSWSLSPTYILTVIFYKIEAKDCIP